MLFYFIDLNIFKVIHSEINKILTKYVPEALQEQIASRFQGYISHDHQQHEHKKERRCFTQL